MPSCAFRKCNNNSSNTNKVKGVTFHSFPQDPPFRGKWINILQVDRRDEEWLPTKFSRVCSVHFKENDLYMTQLGRRKLKHNAIPASQQSLESSQIPVNKISSPNELDVSDTDSIFESPGEIYLKKQLDFEKSKTDKCRKIIIKLRKQNKYLKSKNIGLRNLVKSLKSSKYFKEDLSLKSDIRVKTEEANDEDCEQ